jgi:MYXO-CTERM domain-containing protein
MCRRHGVPGSLGGFWFIGVGLSLTAGTACERRSAADDAVQVVSSALTARSATLQIATPRNSDPSTFVLAASGSLVLEDRAVVNAPISNLGPAGTSVGVDARTAAISTLSALTLRDRALVAGSVATTVPVQAAPTASITGPVDTHAVLTPATVTTISVTFPVGDAPDVNVEPDQSASRPPGRYGAVSVKSRASLALRGGTYYFESLGLEPQATLALDEAAAPVVIYVNQGLTFRGAIASNAPASNLLIGVIGTGFVSIETAFQGTLIAPNASVVLGTGQTPLVHRGAFYARDIRVPPEVTVQLGVSSAFPRCNDGNVCTGRDVLVDGECIGADPLLFGVPESDPTAPRCTNGAAPVGCRGYECTTGASAGVWLASPTCGPFPSCTAACPATGCSAAQPRTSRLVACDCACADPAGGTASQVTIDACAASSATCAQLCAAHGAEACGSASSCLVGGCQAASTAAPRILAQNACRAGDTGAAPQLADHAATVDATASRLVINVGGTTTSIPLSGSLGFHFDLPASSGATGQAVMGQLALTGNTFDFFGRHVVAPRLEATQPATTPLSFLGAGRYGFSVAGGSFTNVLTATVDGTPRSFDGIVPTNLQGTLDLGARTIAVSAAATLPSGDRLTATILGRISNLPPVARMQVTPGSVVECNRQTGADITVDAGTSTDPEAQLLRFQWFRRDPGAVDPTLAPFARTSRATTAIPYGQSILTLVATDTRGAAARAETTVTVRDLTAPSLPAVAPVTFNAGAGRSSIVVALTAPQPSDACDPRPKLAAFRLVEEPDSPGGLRVPIDPNAVELPVGSSTIVWRATDFAGNSFERSQIVQVVAADPASDTTPVVPAPGDCATPLNLPGPSPVPVEVRVCVVGIIDGGVRKGHPVFSECADDQCTAGRIQTLLDQVNVPYAPAVKFVLPSTPPQTMTTSSPLWQRIQDPYPTTDVDGCHTTFDYGQVCIPVSSAEVGTEAGKMVADCRAAWGMSQPTGGTVDSCVRGIVLVLAKSALSVCGEGQASANANPVILGCNFSAVPNNTFDPFAVSGADPSTLNCRAVPENIAHELGHALGLFHGDGLDNDVCNGQFDEGCDNAELNNGPVTAMNGTGGPLFLTDLQRDRARTYALKSVPTIGAAGTNCGVVTPPVPPKDTGKSPPPSVKCGCEVGQQPGASAAGAWLVLVAIAVGRRRRARGRPASDSRMD